VRWVQAVESKCSTFVLALLTPTLSSHGRRGRRREYEL